MKIALELESVSLTALDQTPFEALDENNAFNAVGMRKLAEVIAQSKNALKSSSGGCCCRRAAVEKRLRLNIEKEEQARVARIQELRSGKRIRSRGAQTGSGTQRREINGYAQQNIRAAEITKSRNWKLQSRNARS